MPSEIKTAATGEDNPLTEVELDAVVGGTSGQSGDWISWTRLLVPPVPYPSAQGSRR